MQIGLLDSHVKGWTKSIGGHIAIIQGVLKGRFVGCLEPKSGIKVFPRNASSHKYLKTPIPLNFGHCFRRCKLGRDYHWITCYYEITRKVFIKPKFHIEFLKLYATVSLVALELIFVCISIEIFRSKATTVAWTHKNVIMLKTHHWYQRLGCFSIIFDEIVNYPNRKPKQNRILPDELDESHQELDESVPWLNELTRLLVDFSKIWSNLY